MPGLKYNIEKIYKNLKEECEKKGITTIRFEIADFHGIPRGKIVNVEYLDFYSKSGLNMPPVPLTPWGALVLMPESKMFSEGFPDSYALPDPNTFCQIPWRPKSSRVICDLIGVCEKESPRLLAKNQLDILQSEFGLRMMSGWEIEFFIMENAMKKQSTMEHFMCGNLNEMDKKQEFWDRFIEAMGKMNCPILNYLIEAARGQWEVISVPKFGISSSDAAWTLRNSLRQLAAHENWLITFMAKPWSDNFGSGQHFNYSLWSQNPENEYKINAMSDKNGADCLSDVARHWIAGQLLHAPALAAFCFPTPNCGKRPRMMEVAIPSLATWGFENRTVALRVKSINGQMGPFIENRMPSSATNPYIIMAAMTAAGIDGLRRKIEPPDPIRGFAPAYLSENPEKPAPLPIPHRLDEALKALESDEILRQALGESFVQIYLAMKKMEIEEAVKKTGAENFESFFQQEEISDWEREAYLETL